jgi:valyl-tRNA synthetase
VELTSAAPEGPGVYVGADRLFIPLAGVIDVQKECERARQELTTVEKHRAATAQRLGSESFVSRAPANVVEGARRQLEELETRSVQLRERLEALCGA